MPLLLSLQLRERTQLESSLRFHQITQPRNSLEASLHTQTREGGPRGAAVAASEHEREAVRRRARFRTVWSAGVRPEGEDQEARSGGARTPSRGRGGFGTLPPRQAAPSSSARAAATSAGPLLSNGGQRPAVEKAVAEEMTVDPYLRARVAEERRQAAKRTGQRAAADLDGKRRADREFHARTASLARQQRLGAAEIVRSGRRGVVPAWYEEEEEEEETAREEEIDDEEEDEEELMQDLMEREAGAGRGAKFLAYLATR